MKTQGLRMGRWVTLFLNFLFIFNRLNQAQAHPIVEYWENKTGTGLGPIFDPRVSFFNTSSNYGADSKSNPIPNGVSANQDYFDLNLTWGMTEDWFLFGRLSLLSETVSLPGQAGLSNFGLSDQLLGTTYRVYKRNGFSIDLQFDAVIPAYSNSSARNDGKAYLGDGSDDLTLGAFARLPLRISSLPDLLLEGGVGYTYRSNGFSAAIPVSLLFRNDPTHAGFVVHAGFLGQFSLKSDASNEDPSLFSQVVNDNKMGADGSSIVGGINPDWLSAHVLIGYKTSSNQTFYATITTPFQGTSAPSGIAAAIGAKLDFAKPAEPASVAPKTTSTLSSDYDLEAHVTSVNDQLYWVKIDRGSTNTIEKGQIFDVFQGENRVARAQAQYLKDEEAALNVLEYYQGNWIEKGFTAKRLAR